jgi:hypothetical protein
VIRGELCAVGANVLQRRYVCVCGEWLGNVANKVRMRGREKLSVAHLYTSGCLSKRPPVEGDLEKED